MLSVLIRKACPSTAKVCPSSEALKMASIQWNRPSFNCVDLSIAKHSRTRPKLQPNMYINPSIVIPDSTCSEMQGIVGESCEWSLRAPKIPRHHRPMKPPRTRWFSETYRTIQYLVIHIYVLLQWLTWLAPRKDLRFRVYWDGGRSLCNFCKVALTYKYTTVHGRFEEKEKRIIVTTLLLRKWKTIYAKHDRISSMNRDTNTDKVKRG